MGNIAIIKENLKKRANQIAFISFEMLLFLGCTNIFSLQGYLITAALVIAFFSFFINKQFVLDKSFFFLCFFCLSYYLSILFWNGFKINDIVYYLFGPLVAYQIGQNSIHTYNSKPFILITIFSMALGFFTSAVTSIITTVYQQGILFDGGYLITAWPYQIYLRTGLSLYLLSFSSLCFPLILVKNDLRKWYSLPLFVLAIVFAVWSSSVAGNRSFILVIAGIVLFFCINAIIKFKKFYLLALFSFVIVLPLIVVFLFYANIIAPPEWLLNINVIKRFLSGGSDISRSDLYIEFFENCYKYPFGGMNKILTYVHNVWLDVYNYGGLIPFVLETIIIVDYIIKMRRYSISVPPSSFTKICLITLSLGIAFLSLFEPLVQANIFVLFPLFIIYGYICRKNKKRFTNIVFKVEKI
jgi:hypothetical protein